MSQFPKSGLDLLLGQAHHRCASDPAQGIGGNAAFSYGKLRECGRFGRRSGRLGRIRGEPPCGLDCRSARPPEGGGHKPALRSRAVAAAATMSLVSRR
jgi:hypothetical protein